MRINPRVIYILRDYLTDKDYPSGFLHSSESHARVLSDYIYEYTEGLPIHMPQKPERHMIGRKGFEGLILELELMRKVENVSKI